MQNKLAIIGLTGCLLSCTYDEAPVRHGDVIRILTIEQSSLPADAFSRTKLIAELPIDADTDKRTVEFVTSSGTFAETDGKSTVSITAVQDESTTPFRLLAQATLISSQKEATATVTARTTGYTQVKTCSFTTALPDDLTITPSQLIIKQGAENEVNLTITLTRVSGTPTLNQPIELVVKNIAGKPVGRFRGPVSASDASGKCQAVYTLGTDKYTGKLLVQAKTSNQKVKTDTLYAQ